MHAWRINVRNKMSFFIMKRETDKERERERGRWTVFRLLRVGLAALFALLACFLRLLPPLSNFFKRLVNTAFWNQTLGHPLIVLKDHMRVLLPRLDVPLDFCNIRVSRAWYDDARAISTYCHREGNSKALIKVE